MTHSRPHTLSQPTAHPRLSFAPWVAAVLLACAASGPRAGVVKDPASGCGVHASGHLGSSEFLLQYSGACQDGLAHGQGQATWASKYTPDIKTVWKGRFSKGVYQPEPLPAVPGQALKGVQVLFNLGPLKSSSSVASPRLHVVASHHMRDPASACKPDMLYITAPSEAALGQDDAVQALVRDAMQDLSTRCGKQLDVTDRRGGLRVDLLAHDALTTDSYGNLPNASVRASVSTDGKATVTGYANQVSNKARQAQAESARQTQREATQARLAAFFKQHGAQAWMPLNVVSQNPFRFKDQVLVTAARLGEVESPTTARMVPLNGWPQVRVDNPAVAQWEPGSYLLAFKVVGRETIGGFQGDLMLELAGFERCATGNCSDWLDLPRSLQPGDRP